jgi:hypothetical protein
MLFILGDNHGAIGETLTDGLRGHTFGEGAFFHGGGYVSVPGKFQLSHDSSPLFKTAMGEKYRRNGFRCGDQIKNRRLQAAEPAVCDFYRICFPPLELSTRFKGSSRMMRDLSAGSAPPANLTLFYAFRGKCQSRKRFCVSYLQEL